MEDLMHALYNIPPTFWAAVFGAFIALAGVVFTNHANNKRQEKQFVHERESRNTDRELAMRKEIYLSVAEAIVAGNVLLSKMGSLETPLSDLSSDYLEKVSSVAKLHLMAKEGTVKAVSEVTAGLTSAFLRLTAKRIPLDVENQRTSLHKSMLANFAKERDRWIEAMKQYNLDGKPDQNRWNTIIKNYEFECQRIEELNKNILDSDAGILYRKLELIRESTSESQRIAQITLPAILAMRADLGIETNEASFARMLQRSIDKQRVAVSAFLETVENPGKAPVP